MFTVLVLKCSEHGSFKVTLFNHVVHGIGCPICELTYGVQRYGSRHRAKMTINYRRKWLKVVNHKDGITGKHKYIYSISWYIKDNCKVAIWCKSCKKIFWIRAIGHARGNGCLTCNAIKQSKRLRKSYNTYISEVYNIHYDDYNYRLSDYINNNLKITIICNKCSNVFDMRAGAHLDGQGCPKCAIVKRAAKLKQSLEEFISKMIIRYGIVHCAAFNFTESTYRNNHTEMLVICNKCGERFMISPSKLYGRGNVCPTCGQYGFSKTKPTIFYYIKFKANDQWLYKIGVTNRDVQRRFWQENIDYEILYIRRFRTGRGALRYESMLKRLHYNLRYHGSKVMHITGNTEVFVKPIPELELVIRS